MVPLSEKRHRHYNHEVPEIIQGLFLQLEQLAKMREEKETARIVFRTLYRLMFAEGGGRPSYPPISCQDAQELIDQYKYEL